MVSRSRYRKQPQHRPIRIAAAALSPPAATWGARPSSSWADHTAVFQVGRATPGLPPVDEAFWSGAARTARMKGAAALLPLQNRLGPRDHTTFANSGTENRMSKYR